MSFVNCFIELPCEIISSPKDIEVTENDVVNIVLSLSKPRQVLWVKEKDPSAKLGDHFQTSVSDDGTVHTLTVSKASTDDSGVFVANIHDNQYGVTSVSCALVVKGILCILSFAFEF